MYHGVSKVLLKLFKAALCTRDLYLEINTRIKSDERILLFAYFVIMLLEFLFIEKGGTSVKVNDKIEVLLL